MEEKKMKTVTLTIYESYVLSHGKGQRTGEIMMSEEEFEKFKKNPARWMGDNDGDDYLDFELTNFEIEDCVSQEINWTTENESGSQEW